jgi:nuclear transport factor 2 (NTF2) superfamily protein
MIKVLSLLLTLLMFPIMSNSSTKINLDDYINSFSWKNRIVLFITKEKYIHFINETDDFFKRNSCENEERNLKYIKIVGDDISKYIIPDRYKNKYGIWLIGYDGGNKSYSTDTSLLKEIHNIIDTMPMRKSEVTEQNDKCN